jgi:hypothetical protein
MVTLAVGPLFWVETVTLWMLRSWPLTLTCPPLTEVQWLTASRNRCRFAKVPLKLRA